MQRLERILRVFELSTAILCLLSVTVLSVIRLLLRNYAGSASAINITESITEILPHLVLSLGFLGASLALGRSEAIQIDFLTRLYPPKVQKVIRITGLVAVFPILGFFYHLAYLQNQMSPSPYLSKIYLPLLALLLLKNILVILKPRNPPETIV